MREEEYVKPPTVSKKSVEDVAYHSAFNAVCGIILSLDTEPDFSSNDPEHRFYQVVRQLKTICANGVLQAVANPDTGPICPGDSIGNAPLVIPSMPARTLDDLSPTTVKSAISNAVGELRSEYGNKPFRARLLLTRALKILHNNRCTATQLNVVKSVFPRLSLYMNELCDSDGDIRLVGRGYKIDTMKIRIVS